MPDSWLYLLGATHVLPWQLPFQLCPVISTAIITHASTDSSEVKRPKCQKLEKPGSSPKPKGRVQQPRRWSATCKDIPETPAHIPSNSEQPASSASVVTEMQTWGGHIAQWPSRFLENAHPQPERESLALASTTPVLTHLPADMYLRRQQMDDSSHA